MALNSLLIKKKKPKKKTGDAFILQMWYGEFWPLIQVHKAPLEKYWKVISLYSDV